jgi:hypothetical protein
MQGMAPPGAAPGALPWLGCGDLILQTHKKYLGNGTIEEQSISPKEYTCLSTSETTARDACEWRRVWSPPRSGWILARTTTQSTAPAAAVNRTSSKEKLMRSSEV